MADKSKPWLDELSDSPLNILNYPGYAYGAAQFAGNALSNIGRSMSPVGYNDADSAPDGRPGFYGQIPPMITDTLGAYDRVFNTPGGEMYPGSLEDDVAMVTGAFYGGNALLNPWAKVPKGAVASGAMREGAESAPIRVYHGTTAPPFDKVKQDAGMKGGPFMADRPDVADLYAGVGSVLEDPLFGNTPGRVYPLDINPKNPLRIPSGQSASDTLRSLGYGDAFQGSVSEAAAAKGHDFLVYNDVTQDLGPKHTQYQALQPNTVRSATTGETLFSDNRPSLMGSAVASAGEPKGITAYHGSPHDFDKFSLDKIGTGEGAQAYGHGLYFAENEGVARNYRDGLRFQRPDSVSSTADQVRDDLNYHRGNIDGLRKIYQGMIDRGSPEAQEMGRTKLAALDDVVTANPGRMYQVRINADPNDFLDWDLPLSQQPEAAQKAIQSHPAFLPPLSENPDNFMRNAMRDPETSNMLREAGIPGIRYKDAMSRGTDGGSSNYVVFDDAMIEIMKKYGMAGAVLGAGQLGLGLTGSEANASEYDPELEDILRRFGGY